MKNRLIGFMFGFVIAIVAGLAMLPRAHAETPAVRGIVAMILAIDGAHAIVGAQVIGFPQDMAECGELTKQAQASIPEMHPPKGVVLITACVDMRADNSTSS